ncbi:MAG: lysophospholipid acyltransferase family protein [Candidatus Magnetoovum sp. WYHC-5]|nr:lysophospholipid acyltransferase family protein [Candidatus Magnetoovum sp. WYHC-5]
MTVKEGVLRDILRLIVWFPIRWLLGILPVEIGLLILHFMGDIHYKLAKGKANLLLKNISYIKNEDLPSNLVKHIKAYYRNHYIDRLMIFLFPRFKERAIRNLIEIDGMENIDEALKHNSGVLLVHGHFGPVHIPLVVFSRLGLQMKQIGFPTDEGLSWIGRHVAFRLRLKYEAKIPAQIIMADSFLRPAFKWLKDNGIIMITGDGTGTNTRIGRHHLFDFLGYKLYFPLGPANLAIKTGAAILPLFIVPGENKAYKIIVEKPIDKYLGHDNRDIKITAYFVKRLQYYVHKFPAFWHFLDKFYKGGLIQ